LGEIFVQETFRLLGNGIVTVTEVCISPDLGLAKVYLSLALNKDSADTLAKVEQHKGVIRKLLGERIGNKLRKIPELRFYTDDSVMHAAKIHQLLDGLDIPEDVTLMEHEEFIW
jgi:ribosome-binding factor A